MATFNAGAIEARLTLDRSAFTRELREARAQADAAERDDITIRVRADGSDLTYLQQRINSMFGKSIYVDVRADDSAVYRLQEALDTLNSKSLQIGVRVRDDEIVDLEGRLQAMRDQTVSVEVDVDAGGVATLEAALRGLTDKTVRIEFELADMDALLEAEALVNAIRDERITLDIDIDAGGDLAALEALIMGLPKTINMDMDITAALAKLLELEYAILFAQTTTRSWNMDLDIGAAMVKLELLEAKINSLDNSVRVGVLGGGGGSGGGGGGGGGGYLMLILKIILALAPLVVVAIAGIVAVIVALGAALAGAAVGMGILIGGFIGVIQKYKEMSDAVKNGAGPIGDFTRALKEVKDEFADFITNIQTDAFKTLAVGLNVVADAMPALRPLFHAFNVVLREALEAVGAFVNGPEFDRMVTFFMTTGVQALEGFLKVGGNLILFFGRLFEAFGPFAVSMVDGLANITAGWAEWADGLGKTQGFKDFIAYVSEQGPAMLDMLGSLVDAFINIGIAIAPLAGPMMSLLTAIFDFVAGVDPSILGAIAVAFAAISVAMWLVNTAVAAYTAIMALNPFVLAALAIVGLVAAIIYLWNTNEGFRDALIGAWATIKDGWNDMVDGIMTGVEWLQKAWEKVVEGAMWLYDVLLGRSIIPDIINGIMEWFKNLVSWIAVPLANAYNAIKDAWDRTWATVKALIEVMKVGIAAVFDAVKIYLTTVFEAYKTVITTALEVIKTVFTAAWEAIKTATTAAFDIVKTVITTAWEVIKTIFNTALAVVKAVVTGNFGAIPGIISGAFTSITGIITGAWNSIKSTFTGAAASILATMVDAWGDVKGAVTTGIAGVMGLITALPGKISGALSGFGTLLSGAGRALMQGLANGVREAGQAVIDAAQAIVQKVKDLLPGSPIKAGPLKSWNNGGAGKRLMSMLADGVQAGGPMVASTMNAALSDVADVAGMRLGGSGFIQQRLGIEASVPSVTPQVSVSTQAPDLSALVAENRAMREDFARMVDAYDKMVDQQLVLARQGAIR